MKRLLIGITLIMLVLLSCETKEDKVKKETDLTAEQVQMPKDGDKIAIVKTNLGEVRLRLFESIAPEAVNQFVKNVEEGYYNGLELFSPPNKSTNAFINSNDLHVEKSLEIFETFIPNRHKDYHHYTGAVGFTSFTTSERELVYFYKTFYIVAGDPMDQGTIDILDDLGFSEESIETYKAIGGMPWMDTDRDHPIFAQVYEGLNLLKDMIALESKPMADGFGFVEPVFIDSITIEVYEEGD